MNKNKKGIAIAGNMLVDVVKTIDVFPALGMLSNISSVSQAVGGCVCNTIIDLAAIDPQLELQAIGQLGKDHYGDFVLERLAAKGVDTRRVVRSETLPTSFSDVMSLPSGERTFFHARGANAGFVPEQIDLDSLSCKILHAGYLLLLDGFDAEDPEYGTVMARFLREVRAKGIRTSIDAVSDSSGQFERKIRPALPYCDYVIINEIECCKIWGVEPYAADGTLDTAAIRQAMQQTLDAGVHEKVIVHCKEAGFCMDKSGAFTAVPSMELPGEVIKGSVGAGDAFCAGSLYALYRGWSDEELLSFASASAACSLFSENSVDGMRNEAGIRSLMAQYPRKEFIN